MSIHVLLEAALRSLIMGAIIFTALRLLRIHQVRAHRTAWLLALAGALAMPLLTGAQIGPRVLPAFATVAPPQTAGPPTAPFIAHSKARTAGLEHRPVGDRDGARATPVVTKVVSLAVIGYCLVAAVLLLRLGVGAGFALRLRNHAKRVIFAFDPQLDVRISTRISTPVTIASSVLLPGSHSSWDAPTLRIVLAHERAHVRQADFNVHMLARLHCAIFWFSPFSWWLQRQLSELGEALSDRAAVEQADNRASYAEILLAFAARASWPLAGIGMAGTGNLTPRIERLLSDRRFERSFAGKEHLRLIAAGVVVAAIMVSTSMARVSVQSHTTRTVTESAADMATDTSTDIDVQTEAGTAAHDEEILAIRTGNSRITINNGKRLPVQTGDYIYFQHDGKPYLIQDPDVLAHAHVLLLPMEELARKERELGDRQALLGAQLRSLSEPRRTAKLKVETPDFKRQMAEIASEMKQMNLAEMPAKIDHEALANLQSHLGEIQALVGELQSELGMQESAIGEQQDELGEQQGQLGEQQALLGEQRQKLLEDVQRQLRPLIEKAIREGKGKRLGSVNLQIRPYA
jgi:beta-lactamase regulating signal transducer with metallopeptidase domain